METTSLTTHYSHYRERFLSWYRSHSVREQWLIFLLAGSLSFCAILYGVWIPVREGLEKARMDYVEQYQLLQWMQAQAPAAKQRLSEISASAARNVSLSTLVDDSSKQQGISIKRLEMYKDGGAKITLEQVPFEALMNWLDVLAHTHHLELVSLNVTKTQTEGYVNAALEIK